MRFFRVNESVRSNVSGRSLAGILSLIVAVGICESLLYMGRIYQAIPAYAVLLVVISLVSLRADGDLPVFQAFLLLPVFRLVNLTMPIVGDLTLVWLPFIYGPLLPVFFYIAWREPKVEDPSDSGQDAPETVGLGQELPWWMGGDRGGRWRAAVRRLRRFLAAPDGELTRWQWTRYWGLRSLVVALLPVVLVGVLVSLFRLVIALAEMEYAITEPTPLIRVLGVYPLVGLTVTMVLFVGFVEELLFRGAIQTVLERRLGVAPGLLLASLVFALMHSGHGMATQIGFAFVVGLLFGILYDLSDSIVLVSLMHGTMNVFLFGIIPLNDGSAVGWVAANTTWAVRRVGLEWVLEPLVFPRLLLAVGLPL